jgi:hypothetical protein
MLPASWTVSPMPPSQSLWCRITFSSVIAPTLRLVIKATERPSKTDFLIHIEVEGQREVAVVEGEEVATVSRT